MSKELNDSVSSRRIRKDGIKVGDVELHGGFQWINPMSSKMPRPQGDDWSFQDW